MKNWNTNISYALRAFVALHVCFLTALFVFGSKLASSDQRIVPIVNMAGIVLLLLLLIANWMTRKDQTRRFAKLIDSVLGVGWALAMCALTIWSISMAIP